MLGKRKREVVVVRRTTKTHDDSQSTDRDVFRQYFEATFEPLPESTRTTPSLLEARSDLESEADSAESDWEGLSAEDNGPSTVQVINHASEAVQAGVDTEDESLRSQSKSFMSSRPPREVDRRSVTKSVKSEEEREDDGVAEKLNLKNDLDLQRLLKESNLLEKAKTAKASDNLRHRTIDMRLQELGTKTSLFKQDKMPLAHRKGINSKAFSKEALRRKDAKENGIVLERPSKSTKDAAGRRARGVDIPTVGKFRGGTLQLSRRDISDIQGSPRKTGRGGKGRR